MITLGPGAPGPSNFLSVGQGPLVLLVYRVVAPNAGSDVAGGVKVPEVTLTAQNGSTLRLRPCPFAAAETSFGDMVIVLVASGFSQAADFLQSILTTANQRASIGWQPSYRPATPSTPALLDADNRPRRHGTDPACPVRITRPKHEQSRSRFPDLLRSCISRARCAST
jgi:hypothetical protein